MSRRFDPHDPIWTAWALGELSEAEARELDIDEEALAFAAEVELLANVLEEELATHDGGLSEEQLGVLAAMAQAADIAAAPPDDAAPIDDDTRDERGRRWVWAVAALPAAAALFLVPVLTLTARTGLFPVGIHSYGSADGSPAPVAWSSTRGSDGKPSVTAPVDGAPQAVRGEDRSIGNVDGLAPASTYSGGGDPNVDKYEAYDPGAFHGYRLDQNLDLGSNNVYPTQGIAPFSVRVGNVGPGDGLSDPGAPGRFHRIEENAWTLAAQQPLSTLSIDVDTASYSTVRWHLERGLRPPVGAVRIEELVNYFDYDYPAPEGGAPVAVHTELARSPWHPERQILRVGLQAAELDERDEPPSNLVFLLDVSGSMEAGDRLPLVKRALAQLVEHLDEDDRVAIVVYAGASGLVLPSTPGNERRAVLDALDRLQAGGATAGAEGLQLAYRVARESFLRGGTNRVILATDGDFNVGVTSEQGLIDLARREAGDGIFLTVVGVGMGNYQDATLEQLADKANGQIAFLDSEREARKVFVDDLRGTLHTVAKDVKIQIEFNPAAVAGYRLVGYENRRLAARDFNDDTKDAGELGAGQSVTALYEIVPVGVTVPGSVDALRYRGEPAPTTGDPSELGFVKIRYKRPDQAFSRKLSLAVANQPRALDETTAEFRFATAVAAFGLLLRGSQHAGSLTWGDVLEWADPGVRAHDPGGHRAAFVELVEKARALAP